MGNWKEILDEAKKAGSTQDIIRRKYLKKLSDYTHRNAIAYYSGWLQKPHLGNLPAFNQSPNVLPRTAYDYGKPAASLYLRNGGPGQGQERGEVEVLVGV